MVRDKSRPGIGVGDHDGPSPEASLSVPEELVLTGESVRRGPGIATADGVLGVDDGPFSAPGSGPVWGDGSGPVVGVEWIKGPPKNLTREDADRIEAGTLGTSEVLSLQATFPASAAVANEAVKAQLRVFLSRLARLEEKNTRLKAAATDLRTYGRWLESIKRAASGPSPANALAEIFSRERAHRARGEIEQDLHTYMKDGALVWDEYTSLCYQAQQFGFDPQFVDGILSEKGIPVPAKITRVMGEGWKAHPLLAEPGETWGWSREHLQDALLRKFNTALKVATLSHEHKHSLFAYLEDQDPETQEFASAGSQAAEDAECPALAVWYYLWATGRPALHVGGVGHAPVAERSQRVATVSELEALVSSSTFVLDDLGAALEGGLLETWISVALGNHGPAYTAAVEGRKRARGIPTSQKKDHLYHCVMRVLWLLGIGGIPLWDSAMRLMYIPDVQTLVKQADICMRSLTWALYTGVLSEWLARSNQALAAVANECAMRFQRPAHLLRTGAKETTSDLGLGAWAFLWGTGQHRSLYLSQSGTTLVLNTLDDLAQAYRTNQHGVVGLMASGALPLWIETVQGNPEFAKYLRDNSDLQANPKLAVAVLFWNFFPDRGLETANSTISSLTELVRVFDVRPDEIQKSWSDGYVPWWILSRDGRKDEVRQLMDAAYAAGAENSQLACNFFMWRSGAKCLPTSEGPRTLLPEIHTLPEEEIRRLMVEGHLPTWLSTVLKKEQLATLVRQVFAESAPPLKVRAVRWALGSRVLYLGAHSATSVDDLLKYADGCRDSLAQYLRDGTLRAWLVALRSADPVLDLLSGSDMTTLSDAELDRELEKVLVALGAIPAVMTIEPSFLAMGRLTEGTTYATAFTIRNVGTRGVVFGDVVAEDPCLSVPSPEIAGVQAGAAARMNLTVTLPIGGARNALSVLVQTNVGTATLPIMVTSGVAWRSIVGPAAMWTTGIAIGAAMFRGLSGIFVEGLLDHGRRGMSWWKYAASGDLFAAGAVPTVAVLVGWYAIRKFLKQRRGIK